PKLRCEFLKISGISKLMEQRTGVRMWVRRGLLALVFTGCAAVSFPQAELAQQNSDAEPKTVLPRAERLLLWSPQEKPFGFRNMEKISPVREVRRGPSVFPLTYSSQKLNVSYSVNGSRVGVVDFMEQNDVAGLLIVKN